MNEGNKNIGGAGKTKKGIRWALWLYGFMALCGRFKNIFIVLKLRFIQIFQRKRNYFVQINFAEKNYLFTTASGNLLRKADCCYFSEQYNFFWQLAKVRINRSQF